jgi:hypothetical protein
MPPVPALACMPPEPMPVCEPVLFDPPVPMAAALPPLPDWTMPGVCMSASPLMPSFDLEPLEHAKSPNTNNQPHFRVMTTFSAYPTRESRKRTKRWLASNR